MIKTTTLIIMVFLGFFILPVSGSDNKATQMKIGYTNGNLSLSLGTEVRVISKGAIQFPDSYMERLKGNKIIKIRVAIGDTLTDQENSVFITNRLNGEPIYSQTVARLNAGWNDIILDSPVEITGEELFVGYKYVTRGRTVSFDGGETSNYGNWIAFSENEDRLAWNHQQDCGNLNIEAIVEGDRLPQNDAAIYSVSSKKYARAAHAYPVKLLVKNFAAADIKSLDVTFTIDGQESVTRTVDNLCIKSNEIASVHVDNFIIPEPGIYDMDIRIVKVNGETDESETDNRASIANIVCKVENTNRKVLLEQFSTARCNNCPAAHVLFDNNLRFMNDEVIRLVHHAGFYTDDLTIPESISYVYFYNSVNYAPAAMLDRTNLAQFGALNGNYDSTTGPVFNPTSESIPILLNNRLNTPAHVTVSINNQYNPDSRLLSLTVSGEIPGGKIETLKGNTIRLNIYLIEDSIPGIQIGFKGTYIHKHVIRKALTNVWGDQIEFVNGKYHSNEYTFTIPAEWKEKQTSIVAFIANSDQANPNNAQVYNAEETELIPDTEVAIYSAKENPVIDLFSLSDNLFIEGSYTSAIIYDLTGKPVKVVSKLEHKLSTSMLEDGIYIIQINVNGSTVVRKFLKH